MWTAMEITMRDKLKIIPEVMLSGCLLDIITPVSSLQTAMWTAMEITIGDKLKIIPEVMLLGYQ
jgi:hypothetical protein